MRPSHTHTLARKLNDIKAIKQAVKANSSATRTTSGGAGGGTLTSEGAMGDDTGNACGGASGTATTTLLAGPRKNGLRQFMHGHTREKKNTRVHIPTWAPDGEHSPTWTH